MPDLLQYLESHPHATAVIGQCLSESLSTPPQWVCMIRGAKLEPSPYRTDVNHLDPKRPLILYPIDVIKYAQTAGEAIRLALLEAQG